MRRATIFELETSPNRPKSLAREVFGFIGGGQLSWPKSPVPSGSLDPRLPLKISCRSMIKSVADAQWHTASIFIGPCFVMLM